MKFIRTKNGIYEPKTKMMFNHIKEYKEADTMEELFDELVVKHRSNEKPYIADGYQKHKILEDRQKVFEYGVEFVYGAIYTSKGLIYVAKMDSEGKLVLI